MLLPTEVDARFRHVDQQAPNPLRIPGAPEDRQRALGLPQIRVPSPFREVDVRQEHRRIGQFQLVRCAVEQPLGAGDHLARALGLTRAQRESADLKHHEPPRRAFPEGDSFQPTLDALDRLAEAPGHGRGLGLGAHRPGEEEMGSPARPEVLRRTHVAARLVELPGLAQLIARVEQDPRRFVRSGSAPGIAKDLEGQWRKRRMGASSRYSDGRAVEELDRPLGRARVQECADRPLGLAFSFPVFCKSREKGPPLGVWDSLLESLPEEVAEQGMESRCRSVTGQRDAEEIATRDFPQQVAALLLAEKGADRLAVQIVEKRGLAERLLKSRRKRSVNLLGEEGEQARGALLGLPNSIEIGSFAGCSEPLGGENESRRPAAKYRVEHLLFRRLRAEVKLSAQKLNLFRFRESKIGRGQYDRTAEQVEPREGQGTRASAREQETHSRSALFHDEPKPLEGFASVADLVEVVEDHEKLAAG